MRFIDTHRNGSKLNDLTRICVLDNPMPPEKGGASHLYNVIRTDELGNVVSAFVHFQEGALDDPDAVPGCSDEALIAIVIDRLQSFQTGNFSCEENDCAIGHLFQALDFLRDRSEDRVKRGVEGKYER